MTEVLVGATYMVKAVPEGPRGVTVLEVTDEKVTVIRHDALDGILGDPYRLPRAAFEALHVRAERYVAWRATMTGCGRE